MNVKFYLKSQTVDSTPVYLVFPYRGKRVKIYLGFLINPDHWDKSKMKVRSVLDEPNWSTYNRTIREFRNRAEEAYERLEDFIDKTETIDFIKGVNDKIITDHTFLSFFELVHCKRTPNDQSILSNLKKFSSDLDWTSVQKMHFVDKFTNYLLKQNYSTNYIGRHYKVIKTVLNSAVNDYEILESVNTRHLKVVQEDIDNIYLNETELKAMDELELTGYLHDVRDRFLIGAYTGLRFNDFNRLDPEKDIAEGMIHLVTGQAGGNKTAKVIIPVHPIVKAILERRDYILPRSISNQKMNDYLKILGKKAKIKDNVIKSRTEGGKVVKTTFKKYDLITTHTARRSFATNAFKAGIQPILIMKITGHKTEKNFLKYIKVSEMEAANMLAQSSFFQ